MNGTRALETIWQDTLYAVRGMRKNPVFAATAILILALGIGGNTAMFTIIRAVLLKPLDYRDPDKLVRISGGATPTRFAEMQAGAHSFTAIGAYTRQEDLTLAGGTEPEIVKGVRVSADFLPILGVSPMLGRGFLPADDSPGGPPVVMISAELWQRRFHADPRIVGKAAHLGGHPVHHRGRPSAPFPVPVSGYRRVDDPAFRMAGRRTQVPAPEPLFDRIRPLRRRAEPRASQVGDGGGPSPICHGSSRDVGRQG